MNIPTSTDRRQRHEARLQRAKGGRMNTIRTRTLETRVRSNRHHARATRSLMRRGAAFVLVAFALATPIGARDAKAFCKGGGCPPGTGGHEAITSQGLSFVNQSVLDEINDEHDFI